MRVRTVMVMGVLAATTACGGGGSDAPAQQQTPPDTKQVYSDVWGVGVAPGAEEVPIGQWPSWLREKELVPACAPGEAFYADRCWQSLLIDIDARSVTFTNTSGQSERLAIGAPLPTTLGPMVGGEGCLGGTAGFSGLEGWSCYWPHHRDTGYVMMDSWMPPTQGYFSGTVWGGALSGSISPTHLRGLATTRSPWAVGSQVTAKNGAVAGFLVKTTFLYGFRATTPVPLSNDFVLVHNWPLAGTVRVNGRDLALPLRLSAVTAATGVPSTFSTFAEYIDIGSRTVRFTSDRDVMEARSLYGGQGAGLTDSDLVTSIEFHADPLRPL